jgi:hypothetical protein
MNLVSDTHQRSERNESLGQPRVFDRASLEAMITEAGFSVAQGGGYFIKPFTHAQMAALPFLEQRLIEGLNRLGGELPELASEIYCVAIPAGGRDE